MSRQISRDLKSADKTRLDAFGAPQPLSHTAAHRLPHTCLPPWHPCLTCRLYAHAVRLDARAALPGSYHRLCRARHPLHRKGYHSIQLRRGVAVQQYQAVPWAAVPPHQHLRRSGGVSDVRA